MSDDARGITLDPGRVLPQKPPILMLDSVVEVEPGLSGVGLRRFRPGDACFAGHFPGQPVLPGVLTIEALAQTAMAVLLAEHLDSGAGGEPPVGYLARVHEASFRKPIGPGEDVRFEVKVERRLGSFVTVSGRATSGGSLCAKGKLTLALDPKAGAGGRSGGAGGGE